VGPRHLVILVLLSTLGAERATARPHWYKLAIDLSEFCGIRDASTYTLLGDAARQGAAGPLFCLYLTRVLGVCFDALLDTSCVTLRETARCYTDRNTKATKERENHESISRFSRSDVASTHKTHTTGC